MEKILEFCGQNWQFLVCVLVAVFEAIVLFIRTKKSKLLLFQDIVSSLPSFIKDAEEVGESGENKLLYVLDRAIALLEVHTGQKRSVLLKAYSDLIIDKVEEILSTPQKKGI